MMKVAAPLSILAVAVLAACATGPNNPAAPSSVPVTAQQMPYYAGTGVVQWMGPAPAMASAGPTASRNPAAAPAGMQRLGIRMDNGRMVYVDTSSPDFRPGTRVQLTDNFEIKRL